MQNPCSKVCVRVYVWQRYILNERTLEVLILKGSSVTLICSFSVYFWGAGNYIVSTEQQDYNICMAFAEIFSMYKGMDFSIQS